MNRFKSSLMSRSGSNLMLSLGEYTTSDNEFSNTGKMELNQLKYLMLLIQSS